MSKERESKREREGEKESEHERVSVRERESKVRGQNRSYNTMKVIEYDRV